MSMTEHADRDRPVGAYLREWRRRRRMSQLDLALEAEISSRHLSFIETGRARPSREMVLHLCRELDMPLRDRNQTLLAAGYAPVYPRRALDDPALAAARRAVDMVLGGHEPYPAIAVDRHWNLVAANRAVPRLIAGADPALLEPPVNVLRLSLHPKGLAPQILNLAEWGEHLMTRLRRQIDVSGDPGLEALERELAQYDLPEAPGMQVLSELERGGVVAPMELDSEAGRLSLFSTITVFGTPIDLTLSELAIEAFFPADKATAERLRALAA